ncbi:unnamed protein product [Protopolystoma xenopodis]|uniref:Uncharacterized protein n=1 Tax=Protopolystoma xenopodis TaxID=117903 RepID=A0A448WYJ7_9PLAT|nr:unnamed protein product [Protopolystoma xenopodis]
MGNPRLRQRSSSTGRLWFGDHPVPNLSGTPAYQPHLRLSNIQLQAQAELARRRTGSRGHSLDRQLAGGSGIGSYGASTGALGGQLSPMTAGVAQGMRTLSTYAGLDALAGSTIGGSGGAGRSSSYASYYGPTGRKLKGGAAQIERSMNRHLRKQDGFESLSHVCVPMYERQCDHHNPDHPQHGSQNGEFLPSNVV